MRKPRWTPLKTPQTSVVFTVIAVFCFSGCYSVLARPVPLPGERQDMNVRGAILGERDQAERFEFASVEGVRWTESALVMTGVLSVGDGQITTMSFPLSDVSEVLVRELDGTRASILTAGVLLGTTIVITFALTGKTTDNGPIGGNLRR